MNKQAISLVFSQKQGFFLTQKKLYHSSSKYAVRGLMETLKMELTSTGVKGVTTTTLYPYFVETPLVTNSLSEVYSTLVNSILLRSHFLCKSNQNFPIYYKLITPRKKVYFYTAVSMRCFLWKMPLKRWLMQS